MRHWVLTREVTTDKMKMEVKRREERENHESLEENRREIKTEEIK